MEGMPVHLPHAEIKVVKMNPSWFLTSFLHDMGKDNKNNRRDISLLMGILLQLLFPLEDPVTHKNLCPCAA